MADVFNRLSSTSDFPDLATVNAYQYDNDYDYSRFDGVQMHLTVCTVPWDMGEAHIGARTIDGIGNVVHFGTEAARDAWFSTIPSDKCYRFDTKFRELHRDMTVDVPLPYDEAARYNYLAVSYEVMPNPEQPLAYEPLNGMRKWFYFVREVQFVAPNTTRLVLMDDAWQTWIYKTDITSMMLERGHAPMASVNVSDYLKDPVHNAEYLLAEDASFGPIAQTQWGASLVLNDGNTYACIATTANVAGSWGSPGDGWATPAASAYTNGGAPSVAVMAMAAGDLNTFLSNVESSYPQFKQTIQGVFFAPSKLIETSKPVTFAGVTVYSVAQRRAALSLLQLNQTHFGYPSQYAGIAKLYTEPYAHIEVTDQDGNVDIIRIEDTTGTLSLDCTMSLAYPFLSIEGVMMGAGGTYAGAVQFANVSAHTFRFSGRWYDYLRSWDVPVFAVVQDAASIYDYATYYDRQQRQLEAQNANASALASAETAKTNADAAANTALSNSQTVAASALASANASADTGYGNAYRLADAGYYNTDDDATLSVDNMTVQNTANTSIATYSASVASSANITNNLNATIMSLYSRNLTLTTANNEIEAANQSASIAAASGVVGGIVNGAMGGAAAGPAGIAMGAAGGLVNGAISAVTGLSQNNVATNLTSTQAATSNEYAANAVTQTNSNNTAQTNLQNTANQQLVDYRNTAAETMTNNAATTARGNANRTWEAEIGNASDTQATEKANASRANQSALTTASATNSTDLANNERTYNTAIANANRDLSTGLAAVTAAQNQAALGAPEVYGQWQNGRGSTVKPMALFANIVTQAPGDIAQAGDEFLRYGYRLHRRWAFDGDWVPMRYFSFWQASDFWVSGLSVPDMYMDRLRFFIFGGVTVWKHPEDIGNVSIYDNWR